MFTWSKRSRSHSSDRQRYDTLFSVVLCADRRAGCAVSSIQSGWSDGRCVDFWREPHAVDRFVSEEAFPNSPVAAVMRILPRAACCLRQDVVELERGGDMQQPAEDQDVDRDLERRVVSFLRGRQRSLGCITATAKAGTVTLRGTVRSFYERQLCIEFSRHVAGVVKLVDRIEVADD